MIVLKILVIVLVLLVLLLSVKIGGDIGYDENGIRVYVRVAGITKCLYPSAKEKKPKKRKKTKRKGKKTGKPDITEEEIFDAIAVAVRSVKKLRFRLRKLKLHFVSAFADPYQTAVVYGYTEALVWGLGLPALKQSDIRLEMDFEREVYEIDGYVSVTIRIYYILKLCVCLTGGLIPILWRRRKRIKASETITAVKGKTV